MSDMYSVLILGLCALQPKPVVDVHVDVHQVGPLMFFCLIAIL